MSLRLVIGTGGIALMLAVEHDNVKMVKLLLDAGAGVTGPGGAIIEHGRTSIEGPAEHGRLDILHMLLQVHPRGQGLDEQLEWAWEFAGNRNDMPGWMEHDDVDCSEVVGGDYSEA